jgi:putative FmdB family regulatory protein
MPTYEYACPTCGIVEFFQSIKDEPLARCPRCKKAKVSRLLSTGGGVLFKGSGFWETDYNRSSDYRSRQQAESAPADTTGQAKVQSKLAKTDRSPSPASPS